MSTSKWTKIEFIDYINDEGDLALSPSEIRIDGNPVLVERGSVRVDPGDLAAETVEGRAAKVHLTLLPSHIEFRQELRD
jgi:hypothetical protein